MRNVCRPMILFTLALTSLILVPVLQNGHAATVYAPGLKPGDSAIYARASGSWSLSGPPQPPFSQFITLNYTTLQITKVTGSNITADQTFVYGNKTARSDTIEGNLATDSGNITFWFIAANLTTGDPIYTSPGAPTINQTFTQEFAGATRTVDALNLTQTPAPGFTISANVWWDHNTGILLLIDYRVFEGSGFASFSTELVQTNIWSPGPGIGIVAVPTALIIQQGTSMRLRLALTSERGFSGNVLIDFTIQNCPTGCPTIAVNPTTLQLSSGGIGLSNATISASTSTPPGLYSAVFRALTGGLVANTTYVSIDVVGPTKITILSNDPNSPDWTINSPVWTLKNGLLDGSGVNGTLSPKIISTATFGSDRTIELDVRTPIPGPAEPYYTAWMVGKYDDFYDKVVFVISVGGGVGLSMFDQRVNGTVHNYSNITTLSPTDWHHVKLVFNGNNARAYVNGTLLLNITDSIIGDLGNSPISLASWGDSESQFNHVTVTASVLPDELPSANFYYSPQPAKAGEAVFFNGSGSSDPDGYITNYSWDFGDGSASLGGFPSHTYTNPGSYTVKLTVTDSSSLSATTSQNIIVVQPIVHDVGIISLFASPNTAISGQSIGLNAQLVNLGLQPETVNLTIYYDYHVAAKVLAINIPVTQYPYYVNAVWNTTGVAPGNYTLSATVFLPTDQNLSNNHITDGQVTILPPPVITLTPSSGTVGTQVQVHGSGFPVTTSPYPFPITVQITFDDQFVGYINTNTGTFDFTFNIPVSDPTRPHQIHATAQIFPLNSVRASANFTVKPQSSASSLILMLTVGSIYFPGDSATIYLESTLNGSPTTAQTIQLTMNLPGGTVKTLTLSPVNPGLYKATYTVPGTGSIGTYALVATATINGINATALGSFEVKPTWLQSNAHTIATASTIAGAIGLVSIVGFAWRKGYFTKRKDDFPF